MSRTIHWDDKYCPDGHKWVFCSSSTLYPDFYYCPADDEFWEPTVAIIDPKEVAKNFNAERMDEMRQYAELQQALEVIQYMPWNDVIEFSKTKKGL